MSPSVWRPPQRPATLRCSGRSVLVWQRAGLRCAAWHQEWTL